MNIVIKNSDELTDFEVDEIEQLLKIDSSDTSKKNIDKQYIRWKLIDNPYGSYSVLAFSDKDLLGFLSFTGKFLKGTVVYELGDVIVKPEGRGKGVFFRMLRKFHKEFPLLSCYGTPNEAALPIELKVGYVMSTEHIDYRISPCRLPIKHFFSKVGLGRLGSLIESIINSPLYFFGQLNEKNIESFQAASNPNCMLESDETQLNWRIKEYGGSYRFFCSDNAYFILKIFVKSGYCFGFVVLSSSHTRFDYMQLLSSLNGIGVNFMVELSGNKSRLKSIFSYCYRRVPFIHIGPDMDYGVENFTALDGDNV